ncbi:hypothetical protein [Nocardioides jishulii]|uniref:WXG100 family type VII secretion target n=1 Tax=Nocardioides jishulii TaxID=2575440 RepID=A0A4V5TKS0_9ACTN|nr:hypothetical protein [Nocardioides jishulii]QCX28304.1 hypothetical protein FCL41_12830 [Nocardioides jishulii]TKI64803.1 hypothetical protein FC770_06740 [Nocardioides jishulii]
MTRAIRMTDEVARKVTRLFRRTSESLQGARGDLRGMRGDLVEGAGEFASLIDGSAREFQGCWRATLDVYGDSAAVIAGNTNAQHVDLLKIDGASGD